MAGLRPGHPRLLSRRDWHDRESKVEPVTVAGVVVAGHKKIKGTQ